jgi:hypothetical protein
LKFELNFGLVLKGSGSNFSSEPNYSSTNWLIDEHETQMLDLLWSNILWESLSERVEVGGIFFVANLHIVYQNQDAYITKKRFCQL